MYQVSQGNMKSLVNKVRFPTFLGFSLWPLKHLWYGCVEYIFCTGHGLEQSVWTDLRFRLFSGFLFCQFIMSWDNQSQCSNLYKTNCALNICTRIQDNFVKMLDLNLKMTGGTPEVRSDKKLTLLTFDIWFLTFDIRHMTFDILHSTNGPMD